MPDPSQPSPAYSYTVPKPKATPSQTKPYQPACSNIIQILIVSLFLAIAVETIHSHAFVPKLIPAHRNGLTTRFARLEQVA